MSNLREETFLRVAKSLNLAVEQLTTAIDELDASIYWANTSERDDIVALKKRIKQLANDFNPAVQK